MGVKGLHEMIKNVVERKKLEVFRGHKLAVDASGWLYRGCYAAVEDAIMNPHTDKCASLRKSDAVLYGGVCVMGGELGQQRWR